MSFWRNIKRFALGYVWGQYLPPEKYPEDYDHYDSVLAVNTTRQQVRFYVRADAQDELGLVDAAATYREDVPEQVVLHIAREMIHSLNLRTMLFTPGGRPSALLILTDSADIGEELVLDSACSTLKVAGHLVRWRRCKF